MRYRILLVAAAALVATGAAIAPRDASRAAVPANGVQDSSSPAPSFTKKEVMIGMRDGAHLHTVIFTPKRADGDLPILISRTPYGLSLIHI